MPKFMEIEVWVKVNENEEYAVGHDADNCGDRYGEDCDDSPAIATRLICVTLKVPVPEVVEVRAEIPAESNVVSVSVGK